VKAPSPLLGFNNNVRHKGRVFHIQTEDSGVRHPHVITHLFADGGRILKTTKTSYAEHIGQDRLSETVRAMMQEQHKAMFIALRDGQYDYLFDDGATRPSSKTNIPAVRAPDPPPSQPEAAQAPPPSPSAPSAPSPRAPVEVRTPTPVAARVFVPQIRDEAPPSVASRPGPHYAPTEPARRAVHASAAPPPPPDVAPTSKRRTGQRPTLDVDPGAIHGVGAGAQPSIDMDLDALERAAAEQQTPFFQQIQDLPPPPAAVLGAKRAQQGGYSVRSAPPPAVVPRQDAPVRAATPPVRPGGAPSPGRYAPSRPASIFATTRPPDGASIFGEELISEKSLDEVILGYLAEDLDGPVDKK
jgi:hypothetical protein